MAGKVSFTCLCIMWCLHTLQLKSTSSIVWPSSLSGHLPFNFPKCSGSRDFVESGREAGERLWGVSNNSLWVGLLLTAESVLFRACT